MYSHREKILKEALKKYIKKNGDIWIPDLPEVVKLILTTLFPEKAYSSQEESGRCPECGGVREWYGLEIGDMQGFCKDCGKTWK